MRRSKPGNAGDMQFSATAKTGHAFLPYLRRKLVLAHAMMRPPLAEFSLALVGDKTMAALHEKFMGIAGPTDVLTFELDHDGRGRVVAGEVVVCVPEARRQAAQRGVATRDEVLLYALHGMLHLCGFDDRTERSYRTMHRKEDHILTRLGVGAVFRPDVTRSIPRNMRANGVGGVGRASARRPARAIAGPGGLKPALRPSPPVEVEGASASRSRTSVEKVAKKRANQPAKKGDGRWSST